MLVTHSKLWREGQMNEKKLEECLFCVRTPLEDIRSAARRIKVTHLVRRRKQFEKIARTEERVNLPVEVADELALKAAKLIKKAYLIEPYTICGKKPKSWIAAALYVASIQKGRNITGARGKSITQSDIGHAVGVGVPTIRKRYQELDEMLNLSLRF